MKSDKLMAIFDCVIYTKIARENNNNIKDKLYFMGYSYDDLLDLVQELIHKAEEEEV